PALKVRLNPSAAGVAGEQFEILRDPPNGQSTWFYHQDPTIDVAAVRVDYNFVQKKGLEVSFFAQGQHTIMRDQMNTEQVAAGDGIFVLGFPMNLAGQQRNYVIARQGIIARISEMLERASTTFMIDALIFPGNSGGPVVLRPEAIAIEGTKS